MNPSACERWTELSDRVAIGEPLALEEARFVREHPLGCPACAGEARLWESLDRCLADDSEPPRLVELERAPAVARTPRRPSRQRLVFGAVAALAPAAAAAVWLAGSPRPPIGVPGKVAAGDRPVHVVLVAGEVEVRGVQAAAGAALGATDTLRVGHGRVCLAYDAGISVCADGGSELRLLDGAVGDTRLGLEAGAVVCRLDAPPAGTRFSVETAAGRITAKGTVFAVEHRGGVEVAVRLHRGVVEVETAGGDRAELRAPASAVLGGGIRALPPEGAAWERDGRLSALAELWGAGATAPLDIGGRPRGAGITLDGIELGEAPLSTLVGRGEHRLEVAAPAHATFSERFVVLGAERVSRSFELAPVASAATPGVAPPAAAPSVAAPSVAAPGASAVASAAELLALARAHRSAGRYAEAAATYQRLLGTHPGSGEARAALVSLGELELSRLGQPAAALRSFEAYLAAGGSLEPEARYGRIRALHALGQLAAARAATEAFLRDYPGSAQAKSLREGASRR